MNLPDIIIGAGSIVVGVRALTSGLNSRRPKQLAGVLPADGTSARASRHTVHTIGQRASYIVGLIQRGRTDPRVREFSVRILSRKCGKKWCIPERDSWGEIKALFDAVRQNVRYTRDIWGIDTFQHAVRTLQWGGEDCDGYVITLGSMLQSVGFPVRLRIIRTSNSRDWNHIFLLAGLPPRGPSKWVSLDASVNQPPGWHPPKWMVSGIRDFDVP